MTIVTGDVAVTKPKIKLKPIKRTVLKKKWRKIWDFILDSDIDTPGIYQFITDMSKMEFLDEICEAKLTMKSRNKDRSKAKRYYRDHRQRILNKKKRLEKKRKTQKEVHAKMGRTTVKNKPFTKYPSRKNHIHEEEWLTEKKRVSDIIKGSIAGWAEDITNEHKKKLKDIPIRRKKEFSVEAENKAMEILQEWKIL